MANRVNKVNGVAKSLTKRTGNIIIFSLNCDVLRARKGDDKLKGSVGAEKKGLSSFRANFTGGSFKKAISAWPLRQSRDGLCCGIPFRYFALRYLGGNFTTLIKKGMVGVENSL